jgi:hypothetical protein
MEKKRCTSCLSSSKIIIRSVKRFASPSIQKMKLPCAFLSALDFSRREPSAVMNQCIGFPASRNGDKNTGEAQLLHHRACGKTALSAMKSHLQK